jgi:hypothetical protein
VECGAGCGAFCRGRQFERERRAGNAADGAYGKCPFGRRDQADLDQQRRRFVLHAQSDAASGLVGGDQSADLVQWSVVGGVVRRREWHGLLPIGAVGGKCGSNQYEDDKPWQRIWAVPDASCLGIEKWYGPRFFAGLVIGRTESELLRRWVVCGQYGSGRVDSVSACVVDQWPLPVHGPSRSRDQWRHASPGD